MEKNSVSTPQEVHSAVAQDFRRRRLTYDQVSVRLGYKSKASISCAMSSKDYFSSIMALKMEKAFGYNVSFLLKGEGVLFFSEGDELLDRYRNVDHRSIVLPWDQQYDRLIKLLVQVIDDENLQFALLAYMNGNAKFFFEFVERYVKSNGTYEQYQSLIDNTAEAYRIQHEEYKKEREREERKALPDEAEFI